jgi:hypothetical protein
MRGSLSFISSRQQLSAPLAICSQSQLMSSVLRHGVVYFEQNIISVWHIMGSARKSRRIIRLKFLNEIVPSRQTIHSLVNKLRTTGLLIDKKQKYKRPVLTEKLRDIGFRLEHAPRKSLKRQERQHSSWSHPVRVGVWCAVSARRIFVLVVFLNETINCEKYLRVKRIAFSALPVICEL